MSAPKPSKRDSNKDTSFLATQQPSHLEYLYDEKESTVLDTIFAELFAKVEKMELLTDSE